MNASVKEFITNRTGRQKLLLAGIVVLLLAGALLYLTDYRNNQQETELKQQEFRDISKYVVQFYLHLPGGDYIIGRKNAKYAQLMQSAQQTLCSISGPLNQKVYTEEEIKQIKSQGIALSIWLTKPTKISTAISGGQGVVLDKYQNRVITADRFMITLSGKQRGIYSRNAETGKWQAWTASGEGYLKLIDLIRKGGL